MLKMRFLFVLLSLSLSVPAFAKDLSVLFIGNSYIYLPTMGTPDDPALPKMMAALVGSIDPEIKLKYAFNTPGGYSYQRHYNDPKSRALLEASFDHVILQGQSIESLDLPPEWQKHGTGVQSFSVYFPKVMELALAKNSRVTVFVNWGWNLKHTFLQPGAEGLLFPPGTPKAGQPWCGKDKYEFQQMINQSYARHSSGFKVDFARVGDAWLALQDAGLVGEDDLYIKDDWSHPSLLGAYVEALVLTRDALGLDIGRADYVPEGVDPILAKGLRQFLASRR